MNARDYYVPFGMTAPPQWYALMAHRHMHEYGTTEKQLGAVAIAMRDGPEIGLKHLDAVLEQHELANYYLAHAARADLCRRLGRAAEARSAYQKALSLTQQEPERQFLEERIRQLK
jgi:RNA polymerase sigma-70 factor (ECF subfamily)